MYWQAVTCLGYYYCPLLPLLASLVLVLTFLLHRHLSLYNCRDSRKVWASSSSRALHHILALAATAGPAVLFVIQISLLPSHCGPFSGDIPLEITGLFGNKGRYANNGGCCNFSLWDRNPY